MVSRAEITVSDPGAEIGGALQTGMSVKLRFGYRGEANLWHEWHGTVSGLEQSGPDALSVAAVAAAIAAIVVVVQDFITWLNGGKSALEDLWSVFGEAEEVKASLLAAWEGIKQWFDGILDVLNSIWEIIKFIYTGDPEHLLAALESIKEGFLKIGDVWKSILNWVAEKIKNLLPDWVKELLGIGVDETSPENRATAWSDAAAAVSYGRGGNLAQPVNNTVSNTRNTSYVYTDPVTGAVETILFTRPEEFPVSIEVTLKANSTTPSDVVARVQANIYADFYGQPYPNNNGTVHNNNPTRIPIGATVYASRFFCPAINAGATDLIGVQIGQKDGSLGNVISLHNDQYPSLSIADITVIVQE